MIMKERYLWESWQIKRWLLLFIFCISNSVFQAVAQTESPRIYTEEDPLIYEDARDLWPYSYINDEGEPEGFNIDLIDKLMKALNIPYVVKLKSQQEAFDDLKAGRSDLTLGLATGFHDAYGHYGRHAVTLFTQSVASPKKNKVEIKTFRDLSKDGLQVIVNDSSLCHHLMLDYGWGDHVIATRDPKKAIQDISTKEEGQIVWNTLSLRWLIKRFHLDNMEVTPVNMPHGEYKFMSNDQHLLDLLDETYTDLNLNDEIAPIENKWFYPEHVGPQTPVWVWYFVAIAALLFIIALVFMAIYQIQARRIIKENRKLNRRLALIIETSGVRIWTYDVKQHESYFHDKRLMISIFMSPLNVHANWFPVDGKVKFVKHFNGNYHKAWLPKASEENEHADIMITTPDGQDILVRQIAGALARRIVTYAKAEEECYIDEHLGFIKLGSRVDVFLPLTAKPCITMDQPTTGDQTVIAKLA